MKKITIILILFLSLGFNAQDKTEVKPIKIENVYADSKDGISTVYNDIKSTTPQIKNALNSLAKELKTTTESLWHILVKQQLVWSYCYLILIIASLCNWFLFYRRNLSSRIRYEKVKGSVQKFQYEEGTSEVNIERHPTLYCKKYLNVEEDVLKPIPSGTMPNFKYIHLVICILLSLFSFYHFSDMLTGFINPEFGALKTITEVIIKVK